MRRATIKLLIAVAVLFAAALGTAAPAFAGDGYGSTSTTDPGTGTEPGCSLSVDSGPPGTSVTATVTDVPVGQTVRVLFDGDEVGRAEATSDASANAASPVVLFGGLAVTAGIETATVTIDFVVPSLPAGSYVVVAVGDTFTASCGPGVGGEFGVLAAGLNDDDGSLPKTGIYVGVFLAVGLALVLGGRALVAESRRRRRRANRSATRPRAEV